MSGTILVRGARQLLTLHGPGGPRRGPALRELSIIRDGALLIEEGRISEVGPSRRIENLARAHRAQEIDASGRVVMPGFVDCHTQLAWGVPWLDDFEARMHGSVGTTMAGSDVHSNVPRSASAKRLESRARHLVNGMVRHGTTSLEANSGYGLDQRTELKVLRVQAKLNPAPVDIVSTFWSARSLPAAQAGDPAAYLAWLCSEMLPAIHRKSLARFVGLRCGPVFDAEQGRSYLECARSLGFRVKVHRGTYTSSQAVHMAMEASAQSVDGVTDASPADVERLANSDTMAVLLPGSNFTFSGRDDVPARELIDGGAAVALGTDFTPGASPTYSMQTIVALACGSLAMTAAEAICAATYNSAHAIGSAHVAGSLEVGKPADLIVFDAADYREIPYHLGVNLVHCIVKRGVTIYQEGKVALR